MASVEFIRHATVPEADVLRELHRRSASVWERYRDQLAANPQVFGVSPDDLRRRRVRVAVGANGVLGFSVARPSRATTYELDDLFVEPSCMGQGVGRALVDDVVTIARAAGATRIDVTANEAIGFYDELGFSRGEPTRTQFGPAHRMSLSIR